MKVKELIEELKKYDWELDVVIDEFKKEIDSLDMDKNPSRKEERLVIWCEE